MTVVELRPGLEDLAKTIGRPRRPIVFRPPRFNQPNTSQDFLAAQAEYGGTASPYEQFSSFLNRPVFDRGSLPEMQAPTLSQIGTE